MSDLKSYLYNGVKRKAYEYEAKVVPIIQSNSVDSLQKYYSWPKDTVAAFYLDSLNKKQPCFILLSKNKNSKQLNQFRKIETVDSSGKLKVLFPNQISGYWLNELFYKSFIIIHNNQKINFFALETTKGRVELYHYNGEQLKHEPIYILKKKFKTN